MNDFGPRLPPHLVKRKNSNLSSSDSDEDLIGPLPAGAAIRCPPQTDSIQAKKKSKPIIQVESTTESETVDSQDQPRQESLMEQHLKSKDTTKTLSRLESIKINPNFVAKRNDIIKAAKSLDSKFTKI